MRINSLGKMGLSEAVLRGNMSRVDTSPLDVGKLKKLICEIVKSGINNKEIRSDTDPEEFAVACIEILEGGMGKEEE
jgi:hypothetical protein